MRLLYNKITMKKIHAIAGLLFLLFTLQANTQNMRVATYNLRYDNVNDSGNRWNDRYPVISSLVQFYDFDIFGTQEGLQHQLENLGTSLPAYAWYGVGRDDGNTKGEHAAIFFKKDKFTVLQKGDFWLSETPDKPGPGWDAHLNRVCSWIQFREIKTKKKFYFFNVHFDHQGINARKESSKLILAKIKAIAGNAPVIFTGDLNGGQDSDWYVTLANSGLLKDTYKQAAHPYANNGSFNSFGANLATNQIIDHIFTTAGFITTKWGILTDSYHGKFPSDHFPVMADIQWDK